MLKNPQSCTSQVGIGALTRLKKTLSTQKKHEFAAHIPNCIEKKVRLPTKIHALTELKVLCTNFMQSLLNHALLEIKGDEV